jgi:hypothetical protein
MRISAHDEYDTKTIQLFGLANRGRLKLYRKHSIKYKTAATTQDKQVESFPVMNMYCITGICQFHRNVANCDKWFTYKGAKLHRFYCIFITTKATKHMGKVFHSWIQHKSLRKFIWIVLSFTQGQKG